MADPTDTLTTASTSNTKLRVIEASRCRCREPHDGHGLIAQMASMTLLAEAVGNESISTPSKATQSTPPSSQPIPASDTPRKTSSSNGTPATRQERRKAQIALEIADLKEELCTHCFFSSFFPNFDDEAYKEKINSLPLLAEGKFKLTSPSPSRKVASPRVAWPTSHNEREFYSPLAALLNEIADHFSATPNPNNNKNVQFIVYDKPVAPVTSESLKPGLLLVEEIFAQLASCRWEHPIVSIEVKNEWLDALNQLGTYAREMLRARPGRQFCWGLYFNHAKSYFRLVLFTPDRVHFTQSIVITSETGYRELVKCIVALLSQPDLVTLGEDPSRDGVNKLLPNGDKLEIQSVEFDRKSLVGRRTRILSVAVVDGFGMDSSLTKSPYSKLPPTGRNSGLARSPPFSLNRRVFTPSVPTEAPTSPSSAAVSPSSPRHLRSRSIVTPPSFDTGAPSSSRPSRQLRSGSFVTSPSFNSGATSSSRPSRQLRSGSIVASPFSDQDTGAHHDSIISSSGDVALQESTSELPPSYRLKELRVNPKEAIEFVEGRNQLKLGELLVVKESWPLASRRNIEWDALKSCLGEFGLPEVIYKVTGEHPMSVTCTREPRVPIHIGLREKGHRLQEAESPRILLTAVIHAIIGHWNLFHKGWLHRDVSIGNVLLLAEPVDKSAPTGLEGLDTLTHCQGMLIDGDAMIHFRSDREPGSHRSCTPPFLSRRLVDAWMLGAETFDQYFDDLESFAWVLLWALIEIAQTNNTATPYDQHWMGVLNADDFQSLVFGKVAIVTQLQNLSKRIAKGSPKSHSTSISDPFIEILDRWFDLIGEEEDCDNSATLSPSKESTVLYEALITFAMEKLPDLPEKW